MEMDDISYGFPGMKPKNDLTWANLKKARVR